jgi:hypothetical protein
MQPRLIQFCLIQARQRQKHLLMHLVERGSDSGWWIAGVSG